MENNIETSRALATRIYDLDSEVYRLVGSSLGRTFTGDKETSIRNLTTLISTHPQGHLLRSEIALIGKYGAYDPQQRGSEPYDARVQ